MPFIRLEGLNHRHAAASPSHSHNVNSGKKRTRPRGDGKVADLDSASLSDFLDSEQQHEARPPHSSSVLWKRLEPLQEEGESCRIVDALLENWEDKEGRHSKRRKLTLLETSNRTLGETFEIPSSALVKRKLPIKVLDPLTRLVDDSLQLVHSGSRPVSEHFQFITTDPRLAIQDVRKWLQWCHSSGGNLLHACALWNDMETAGELLQMPNLAGPLCQALDGDGRTPYEVAQLSGHDSVCEVLEAFGGDTTNYVYDIFCLEEQEDNNASRDESYSPTTVELTSGVAYWTPDGELMLEANDKASAYLDDYESEIDSNCEDYDANDYPDEDEEVLPWGYEDHLRFNHMESPNIADHNQDPCALDRYYMRGSGNLNPHDEDEDFEMAGGPYDSDDPAISPATSDM